MNVKQTVKQLILGALIIVGLIVVLSPITEAACGGVQTSIINCEETGGNDVEQTGIWGVLLIAINILTAGIGIVAIGGVVYASIMYASAGGNAEQTKKAMEIIMNIVIGVLAYALMFALLNFLIPGGLFN